MSNISFTEELRESHKEMFKILCNFEHTAQFHVII